MMKRRTLKKKAHRVLALYKREVKRSHGWHTRWYFEAWHCLNPMVAMVLSWEEQ